MKNKFKKLAAALACLLLILAQLVSCGSNTPPASSNPPDIDNESIPGYTTTAYSIVNGNIPLFEADDIPDAPYKSYEYYSELDALDRCGVAVACIGIDIMPTEDREGSLSVDPSGWYWEGKSNNNKYDFVSGGYVYNRCHLIGYQLTAENSNEKNLITGTRFLNIEGMLPFENWVSDAIKEAHANDEELHVMYRVTPHFEGNNLVASGVLIEGYSLEDEGESVCFCVYAYNVQPGVTINYYTGENEADPDYNPNAIGNVVYVLNTSSKKYHLPTCTYVSKLSAKNRDNYTGKPEDFSKQHPGYSPCGTCKPNI